MKESTAAPQPSATWIGSSLCEAVELAKWLTADEQIETLTRFGESLVGCFKAGGRAIACGNGGSMSDAMHFAEELSARYRVDRAALPALSISDPAHITCTANDWGFDYVFARGVEAHGRPGDILVAFSTSGNSANVLRAALAAKDRGMTVLAMTGRGGGTLLGLSDEALVVPAQGAERIQEVHIKAVHLIVEWAERALFPSAYGG